MALPTIKAVQDSADYSKVVAPFLPQLYELPGKLLSITGLHDLELLYLDTNPLVTGCAGSIAVAGVTLVLSELNGNYSQIDRLWSLLPSVYTIHTAVWARLSGLSHARLDMVAAATTIWSMRLTYNYWRKGGYKVGSEDYRWDVLRAKNIPKPLWFLFNLSFISLFQSFLLFLISGAPAYVVLLSSQKEPQLKATDFLYLSIHLALVWAEWVTDGQQWNYQTAKKLYQENGTVTTGFTEADLQRGFVTKGPWAYSRHPNFFAEQSFWFVLYNWSCYASDSPYCWAGVGAGCLVMLFQGSTGFSEGISGGKYPEYAEYQKQVGMFIPVSFRGYKAPVRQPRIIRTSELARRRDEK